MKSCCGQVPTFWVNGQWRCMSCDGIVTYEEAQLSLDNLFDSDTVLTVKCDCGAEKTKTTHANWCSTKGVK